MLLFSSHYLQSTYSYIIYITLSTLLLDTLYTFTEKNDDKTWTKTTKFDQTSYIYAIIIFIGGCSSAVEHLLSKQNVRGSIPLTRSQKNHQNILKCCQQIITTSTPPKTQYKDFLSRIFLKNY